MASHKTCEQMPCRKLGRSPEALLPQMVPSSWQQSSVGNSGAERADHSILCGKAGPEDRAAAVQDMPSILIQLRAGKGCQVRSWLLPHAPPAAAQPEALGTCASIEFQDDSRICCCNVRNHPPEAPARRPQVRWKTSTWGIKAD